MGLTEIALRLQAPYKGLAPFAATDVPLFFGRTEDWKLLVANLRSAHLTLLYGASGVGKSSLIQAGVVPHIRRLAQENKSEYGSPEIAVALLNDWSGNPQEALRDSIAAAVTGACGASFDPLPHSLSLADIVRIWTQRLDGTLLVVFDQFEDYLSHQSHPAGNDFDRQLAAAINDPDLRFGCLISLQQEALSHLDRFSSLIPRLFANYLRLDHLDREGAREAITGPLAAWNQMFGLSGADGFSAEEDLINAIRNDPAIHRTATAAFSNDDEEASTDRIETTYLQLVLRRLWDEENRLQSRVLRSSTLAAMGGAKNVVRRHVDEVLATLPARERTMAARLLRELATSTGEKTLRSAEDLAHSARLPLDRVQRALDALAAPTVRVLRRVMDVRGIIRYEVFHDVLIPAIADWHEHEQTRVVQRRSFRLVAFGIAFTLILVVLGAWVVVSRRFARIARDERLAQSARLRNEAATLRSERLDLSLLLSLHAYEIGGDTDSLNTLVDLLTDPRSRGEFVGWAPGPVLATALSPGRAIAAATDRTLRLWGVEDRRLRDTVPRLDRETVSDAAFSRDGRTLGLIATDGVIRTWSVSAASLPLQPFQPADDPSAIAMSLDGASVAVGTANGVVEVWSTNPPARVARAAISARSIEALAFSPDRQQIAVGTLDGTIHLLSAVLASRGSLRVQGGKISEITFDDSGHFLAAGETRGTVQVWSLAERKLLGNPLVANSGAILSVSFSPNTQIIAAGSERGAIHLWATFTGEPLREPPLQSHPRGLRALTFAPDGRSVFSGQDDGSVRRWAIIAETNLNSSSARELNFVALRSHVCRIANRSLSHQEWERYFGGNVSYRETCPGLPAGDDEND